MLTLEEQERRAYISGQTELAEALRLAIKADSDAVRDLKGEVESLKKEVERLEARLWEAEG